jgi:hypothetical protein
MRAVQNVIYDMIEIHREKVSSSVSQNIALSFYVRHLGYTGHAT